MANNSHSDANGEHDQNATNVNNRTGRWKHLRWLRLQRQQLNEQGLLLRKFLVAIDVFYLVVSIVIMGLGGQILDNKDNAIAIFGYSTMSSAAALIIIGGALITLVAVAGISAVIIRNKHLMMAQIVAVVIILVMAISGSVGAFVFKSQISAMVKQEMKDSLTMSYGVFTGELNNAHITDIWDKLQNEYYCCGVDERGWQIYQRSAWFTSAAGMVGKDRPYVPKSCCVYNHHSVYLDTDKCRLWEQGPPALQSGKENEALHTRGCFEASDMLGLVWFNYVAAMGVIGSVILVIGLVLSVKFYRLLTMAESDLYPTSNETGLPKPGEPQAWANPQLDPTTTTATRAGPSGITDTTKPFPPSNTSV